MLQQLGGGGPGRSRTADLRFRKPLLYPSELRGLKRLHSLGLVYNSAGRMQLGS
jgi:hypothetical protein